MIQNGFATLALAFGAQQTAWTLLDYQGLMHSDYPPDSWPYDLNPWFGGIIALIAITLALAAYETQWSISRIVGTILAVAAGIQFWILRHPAEPYKDYGEDNLARMIINELCVGVVMIVVCVIDYLVRLRLEQMAVTDQGGEGSDSSDLKDRD